METQIKKRHKNKHENMFYFHQRTHVMCNQAVLLPMLNFDADQYLFLFLRNVSERWEVCRQTAFCCRYIDCDGVNNEWTSANTLGISTGSFIIHAIISTSASALFSNPLCRPMAIAWQHSQRTLCLACSKWHCPGAITRELRLVHCLEWCLQFMRAYKQRRINVS